MSTDLISLGSSRHNSLKDQISPYKIALLVLIEDHCTAGFNQVTNDLSQADADELQFLITLLQLMQSPDVDLVTLKKRIQQLLKAEDVRNLTNKLCELYDGGVNALMNLMQSIRDNILSPDTMTTTSICGLFIRRLCLAFDKLSFAQVVQLYKKFSVMFDELKTQLVSVSLADCQSAPVYMLDLSPTADQADLSVTDSAACNSAKFIDAGRSSVRQAEYFIAQQTLLLIHNEQEALSATELQHKITDLLHSNPDIAEAHYLSYLNYLRVRDYCATVSSLYHYYDRCHSLASQSTGKAAKTPVDSDDTVSRSYRYAALGLAATQFHFGHRKEALAAVQESIRMSQETNDPVCLQHALGWLQRLAILIEGGQHFLLEKLVATSAELNLPYLTSVGVQAFARHNALSCVQPSVVFESIVRSDLLNCQHSLSDLVSVGLAQKASLWQLYGRSEMCLLNAQLVLNLSSQEVTTGVYHNAEPECVALCQIAQLHADQGLYDCAFQVLRSASERFPASCHNCRLWMSCQQLVRFMACLHRCKFNSAEHAISCLASVDKLQADYCRCLLLTDCGESSSVVESVDVLVVKCRQQETSQQHFTQLIVKLLCLKGLTYCSTENPSLAVNPLLEALTLAKQCHYNLLTALVTLHLAFVQYCLRLPKLALDHVTSVYAVIMSQASLFDRARTVYLIVKCQLAMNQTTHSRNKVVEKAVNKLDQVIAWFRQLESYRRLKDALYLQSRLYSELGWTTQRNKTANEFHHLDLQYPTINVDSTCQL